MHLTLMQHTLMMNGFMMVALMVAASLLLWKVSETYSDIDQDFLESFVFFWIFFHFVEINRYIFMSSKYFISLFILQSIFILL